MRGGFLAFLNSWVFFIFQQISHVRKKSSIKRVQNTLIVHASMQKKWKHFGTVQPQKIIMLQISQKV